MIPTVLFPEHQPSKIARVALDLSLRREFDYLIPPELVEHVVVGSRVKVPFGSREVLGCVLVIVDESPHGNLKPITKVLSGLAPITPTILKLASWIAEYYCCPIDAILKTVLPEAVRREEAGWRERLVVRPVKVEGVQPTVTKRQQLILDLLLSSGEMPLQRFLAEARTSSATLRRMEEQHLLEIVSLVSERDPYANETIIPTQSLVLNAAQETALGEIRKSMESGAVRTFLLHGVTGSGKTEVYLQAILHALASGKGALVLVPEISLTPQTVERFKARFSHGAQSTMVAVLHSHLSAGERHDEWQKIREGRARIVIGARSAIFAPVQALGLIVVDEEHEHSYKQEETPRYHARDVAVYRGVVDKAVVVLGTATPSLESYHNALSGKYGLLRLPERADNAKLPIVRVIDMRSEGRNAKGPPIFSGQLKEAVTQRLERREQTMLFLNRRGYASSLQCPLCGYVAGCPNCSISLTYHRGEQRLRCHICGHAEKAPSVCPQPKCRNPAIRFSGLGTEKVEETLHKMFPKARVARMDSDTLRRKEDYREVLGNFKAGRIDILVGTQMIAKGLHFPNVTLVGIIHADLSLHMPDFRAAERTFQLLTQVAGRAGRGDVEGEVFVQAFTPFAPAIQFAKRHDFEGFYEAEIDFRQQLGYPPFARVALLTVRGKDEEKTKWCADYLKAELDKALESDGGWKDLILAGPAPAPLLKAETYFRFQIMLRHRQMSRLAKLLKQVTGNLRMPEEVFLAVDVDPASLQ